MPRAVLMAMVAAMLAVVPALALEITSVAPARAVPGTRVMVTGGIFSGESRIYLGEQFVAPQQVRARQLDFVVPDLEPGNYTLTVQDDIDSVAQPFDFEILPPRPQISAVDPDNLVVCADEAERSVRVRGRNFRPGTALLLGGNALASRTIDGETIEFQLPGLPAGVYGIEARNPDGAASLPRSLWVNSVPEISAVERGRNLVNQYEVIIKGQNFFFNSILVVRETDNSAGGFGTRQMTYYAHRNAPGTAPESFPAAGEQLRYDNCRTLVYLRSPSDFQDKELTLQVVNPDGRATAPYPVALP